MDDLTRLVLALLVIAALALIAVIAPFGSPGNAATVTPGPPKPSGTCTELVADGGFEAGGAWQLGVSPVPPQVVTYSAHSGTHSLQMGITSGANVESFSSARQKVSIPANAAQVTLSFWYYAMAEAPATTDYMELVLLNADGTVILGKPWQSHNDSRLWNRAQFDLTAWRGQTLQLYFNVYNDGIGGRAAMFLDDVSLSSCPAPVTAPPPTITPTRTPVIPVVTCVPICTPVVPPVTCVPICTPWPPPVTPTVTKTPTPSVWPTAASGCQEVTQNGGFESGTVGWTSGSSSLPPRLVTNPALGGLYSLQLGSQLENRNTYSSIRQTVTLPSGYARAIVSYWAYTWAESSSGSDRQQFVILGPGDVVWAVPWKVLENARTWKQYTFDLSDMVGKTFDLYFAAVNDGKGGRTVLLLDEVHLWGCAHNAYPSIASPPIGAEAAPIVLETTGSPEAPAASGVQPLETLSAVATAPAETLPAVVITPVETLSAAVITPVETLSAVEAYTISETPLPPGARWTEVAISGAGAPGAAAIAGPGATPAAPELAGADAGSASGLGGAAATTATPAPRGIIERAIARWPVKWYWVAGAILFLVLLVTALLAVGRNATRG